MERGIFSLFQSSYANQQKTHKRIVTDFRHLNVRIAKDNLAYSLLKDTFSVLGSSKCKVLSLLDLKDAFHSLRLSEPSKKYYKILSYFGSTYYLYQRMPMGQNIHSITIKRLLHSKIRRFVKRHY